MPEITSRERIIEKLRDFDERMDGAIAAAKIMADVKANVLEMRDSIHDTLQESKETQELLKNLQVEWEGLKGDVAEVKKQLANEIHQTLIDHKELERMSREHKESAAADCKKVIAQADSLNELLKNSRQDLETDIKDSLKRSEKLIKSKIDEAERHLDEKQQDVSRGLEEKADNFNSSLNDKLEIFKKDVKKELHDHQQGVERHLTEFLNKQNTLVQNLTQQIDGFHRSAQALTSEQQQIQQKVNGLEKKIIEDSTKQDAGINRLQSQVNSVAERLEQVITRLQGRLFSGAFKGL